MDGETLHVLVQQQLNRAPSLEQVPYETEHWEDCASSPS